MKVLLELNVTEESTNGYDVAQLMRDLAEKQFDGRWLSAGETFPLMLGDKCVGKATIGNKRAAKATTK